MQSLLFFARQSRRTTSYAPHQKPQQLRSGSHFGNSGTSFILGSSVFAVLAKIFRKNLEFAQTTCIRRLYPLLVHIFRGPVDLAQQAWVLLASAFSMGHREGGRRCIRPHRIPPGASFRTSLGPFFRSKHFSRNANGSNSMGD